MGRRIGRPGSKKPLRMIKEEQVKLGVLNLYYLEKNISATQLQKLIGGLKLTPRELNKYIRLVNAEYGLKLKKATVKNQPRTAIDTRFKYLKVRPFILQMALEKKPISPTLIKKIFGSRIETATKFINWARKDQDVCSVLGRGKIIILKQGQNHNYDIDKLKAQFNPK